MTDKAARNAARQLQAADPEISYTRALRQVSHKKQRRPLATVLGLGFDGQSVALDLEWVAHGGSGPHVFITGRSALATSNLLKVILRGLHLSQQTGDEDFVVTGRDDALPSDIAHRFVPLGEFPAFLDDLIAARRKLFAAGGHNMVDIETARAVGLRLPTIVVAISSPTEAVRPALETPLRIGRALGISIILATDSAWAATVQVDTTQSEMLTRFIDRASGGGEIEVMFNTRIFALEDGRAIVRRTSRRPDQYVPLMSDELVVVTDLVT